MQKIINLIRPEESDVNFKIIVFPDGEPHIILGEIDRKCSFKVICRITNPTDLFIVAQVGDILNRQGVSFTISIKYLMSMRMDRVMSFNEAYSLRIVMRILKATGAKGIYVLEPHNKIAILDNGGIIMPANKPDFLEYLPVFPDKGAFERYRYSFGDAIICSKVRDTSTGKLTGFSIENPELFKSIPDKPLMVIDDLCDGGGTFAGIAELLEKECPDRPKSIYVTHAVNARGIENMSKHYNNVYITDSYKDWQLEELPKNVTVIEIGKWT